MDYAVIKTGGKQYKVEKGTVLEVDRIDNGNNEPYYFDKVLLRVNEEEVKIGQPYVNGAQVKAKVLEDTKSEKVMVSKFKAKAKYRRTTGFRASITRLVIEDIDSSKKA